jgi:hypothetical protein
VTQIPIFTFQGGVSLITINDPSVVDFGLFIPKNGYIIGLPFDGCAKLSTVILSALGTIPSFLFAGAHNVQTLIASQVTLLEGYTLASLEKLD